jgi:hypothetical protein
MQLLASAFCLLVCVALFAVAWSSYSWVYLIDWHSKYAKLQIISGGGRLKMTRIEPNFGPFGATGTRVQRFPIADDAAKTVMKYVDYRANSRGFGFRRAGPMMVAVPYWYMILVTAILAAFLAFKRTCRFGTRSILVAVAIVAVLLGIVVAP